MSGYNLSREAADTVAERAGGEAFERIGGICRRHRIALLYGFIERDGETLYNTVQLIDPGGASLARYRKTHLWGDLDRSLFAAGDDLAPLVEFDGWRIGLLICYDVEFPETVRRLALEGADLVLVPTALMRPFTFVADHLVRVRAAENGLFLALRQRPPGKRTGSTTSGAARSSDPTARNSRAPGTRPSCCTRASSTVRCKRHARRSPTCAIGGPSCSRRGRRERDGRERQAVRGACRDGGRRTATDRVRPRLPVRLRRLGRPTPTASARCPSPPSARAWP